MYCGISQLQDKYKFILTAFSILSVHILTQLIFTVKKSHLPFFTLYTYTFNFLSIFVYVYFILTNKNKGFVNSQKIKLISTKYSGDIRDCKKCNAFKPERAHHCSVCGTCIKMMDHHCGWLNVCINFTNMAHFVRFLFFSCLSTFFCFLFMTYSCLDDLKQKTYKDYFFFVSFEIITAGFVLFVCAISGMFFFQTLINVVKNITYLEMLNLKTWNSYGNEKMANPYDLGYYKNFRSIMGQAKFLFLCGTKGDGVHFQKTYAIFEWPPKDRVNENQERDIFFNVS
ncbi:hypothetical protein GVAV_003174 [Gurleya vavrai]